MDMAIFMTDDLSPSEFKKYGARNLTINHVWIDLCNASERPAQPAPALFLDRDGVIVVDTHYVCDPEIVELLPGAAKLINAANTSGVPVIVVTNQSGIGRGYFGWPELGATQDRVSELLAEHDARWDAVLACPHHRVAPPPYDHPDHPCRKPNPGMINAAQELLNIDLGRSWIVGDNATDIEAGRNAGLKGGVHVATHPSKAEQEAEKAAALKTGQFQVITNPDLEGVWDLLIY